MRQLRGEEQWAAKMIEAAMLAPAQQHDDGSRPGMYDLDIVLPGGDIAAVEVTAAGDPVAIEHWNLMNGGDRWIVDTIHGGWMVEVHVGSSWKRLKAELPALLAELEMLKISAIDVGYATSNHLKRVAADLGISSASQSGTEFPGSIYMTFAMSPQEERDGDISDQGEPLATWLSEFLRKRQQADVLHKLASSGADQRHAFIFLPGFNTAPWAVNYLLIQQDPPVPIIGPNLPDPVTHVWAVSTWNSGVGLRWSPRLGWLTFDKALDNNGKS